MTRASVSGNGPSTMLIQRDTFALGLVWTSNNLLCILFLSCKRSAGFCFYGQGKGNISVLVIASFAKHLVKFELTIN